MPHRRTVKLDFTISMPMRIALILLAWCLARFAARAGRGQEPQQRLPGLPFGQDAHQDQRRRQGGLLVRGRSQAQGDRPQDQYLRGLPRGYHLQAPGRQRAGPAAQLRQVPRARKPKTTPPASTARATRWALPAPPVAGIATARTTCSRPRTPSRRSSS